MKFLIMQFSPFPCCFPQNTLSLCSSHTCKTSVLFQCCTPILIYGTYLQTHLHFSQVYSSFISITRYCCLPELSALSCTWDSVHTLLMRLLISPHFLVSNWKLFWRGLSTATGSPMSSVFIPQYESKRDLYTYIKMSQFYIVICLSRCFHGYTHSLQANTRAVYMRKTNKLHLHLINLSQLNYLLHVEFTHQQMHFY